MERSAVVVGGGASGMMTAYFLSARGFRVTLTEKNEKLGKKIFITGKGRCNFTNACDKLVFFDSVTRNRSFMYSSYNRFDCYSVMELFNSLGLDHKTERGNRVFPVSDKAYEVTDVLRKALIKNGVKILLNTEVTGIITEEGSACGVTVRNLSGITERIISDRVIIATGGITYSSTGSTGDGYRFARENGIKVTPVSPSLVPLILKNGNEGIPAGLTLKNVELALKDTEGKCIFKDFGEMLFTHAGVSGPLVLKATSVAENAYKLENFTLHIDLKPRVSTEMLDERLKKLFERMPRKKIVNVLKGVYPSALIPVILGRASVSPAKQTSEITKDERFELIRKTKDLVFTVERCGSTEEAVITRGGVDVKELDPKTMESKNVKGLYFTGEVIDVDALTGGFNLQIAWSTAFAAGNA